MSDAQKMAIYTAVLKIVGDLTDRRGLCQAWDDIDEEIQAEIIQTWRDIVIAELDTATAGQEH